MSKKHLVVIWAPGVKEAAESEGLSVTLLADGKDAEREISNLRSPDIFLLPVLFPYGNAYEIAPVIRRCHPDAQVWLISARAEDMREEIESDPNFDRILYWAHPDNEVLLEAIKSFGNLEF